MTSLRERRLEAARRSLEHFIGERDKATRRLVRCEKKVGELQRTISRLEKIGVVKPKVEEKPTAGSPGPALLTELVNAPFKRKAESEDIPEFLKRKKEGEAKDAAAREEVAKGQAERKLAKSRGRIAKLKADKAGERAKMPLTGRAALAALK